MTRFRGPRWIAARVSHRLGSLKPRTEEDRNINYVALDGLAAGMALVAANFMGVFVVRLGGDAFLVSLLSSLPSLIQLLLTLPMSRFVERQARVVSVFAWSRLLNWFSYFVIALMPFVLPYVVTARLVVAVSVLAAVPAGAQQLAFSLAMNRSVHRERRAVLMSTRWAVMGISRIGLLFVVGLLLDAIPFPLNYQVVFLICFGAGLLAFTIIRRVRVLEEPPPRARSEQEMGGAWLPRLKQGIAEVIRRKSFIRFSLGRNAYWLGIAMIMPMIPIYYIVELQVSDAWVGYFSTAVSVTSLVGYALWVRVKRKLGNRFVLLTCVLGRSLYPFLVSLTASPLAMLLVAGFSGLAFSGMNLMFFDVLMDTLPKGDEARFLAINQTLTGLIGFIAPPIGAWMLSLLGIRPALWLGSAMAFCGFMVFLFCGVARPARATPAEAG